MVYDSNATDPTGDATHPSDGPSNPLTYTLGGTDAARSEERRVGKKGRPRGKPNHESQQSYSFDVTATDTAGNFTTQTVSLAINNLDEVAPTFSSGTTATAINENSCAG